MRVIADNKNKAAQYRHRIKGIKLQENVIDFEWETEKLLQQKEETMKDIAILTSKFQQLKQSIDNSDIDAAQQVLNDQSSTLDETIKEVEANTQRLIMETDNALRLTTKKLYEVETNNLKLEGRCKTAREELKIKQEDAEISNLKAELKSAEAHRYLVIAGTQ